MDSSYLAVLYEVAALAPWDGEDVLAQDLLARWSRIFGVRRIALWSRSPSQEKVYTWGFPADPEGWEQLEDDAPNVYACALGAPPDELGWVYLERSHSIPPHQRTLLDLFVRRLEQVLRLKRTQAELIASERRYRELLNTIAEGVFETDAAGNFRLANHAMSNMLGLPGNNLTGRNLLLEFTAGGTVADVRHAFAVAAETARTQSPFPWHFRRTGGDVGYAEISLAPVVASCGTVTGYRGVARDLTERQQAREERQVVLDAIPDQVVLLGPDLKVDWANQAESLETGLKVDEMKGRTCHEVRYTRKRPCPACPALQALRTGQLTAVETTTPGGRILDVRAVPVFLGNQVRGIVRVARDVTEVRQAGERVLYMTTHDLLTGLYNRAYLEEELKRLDPQRQGPVAAIICDLDGLRLVNDTLGHQVGNELLLSAARTLRRVFRASDMLARAGGDEFVAVLTHTDSSTADVIRERILAAVEESNTAQDGSPPLSLSVGTAATDEPGVQSVADTLRRAEKNLQQDKLTRSGSARNAVVQTLLAALGQRDYITEGHAVRLATVAGRLGRAVGISSPDQANLRLLAQVHDIGKVGVPDHILFKPGKLTRKEWVQMKRHSEIGYRIALSSPQLTPVAHLILQHHEWWNGDGYPQGLKDEQIHICARILSVADAYDAMTSDRPYRKALSHEQAIEELRRGAGAQFDPTLVAHFIALLPAATLPPAPDEVRGTP